ncbi:hypothetical protein FOA52_009038 [Chlamydomonas sp. UWO 241]|nr:hypothetical protein FOA52_009038 [Chlamydomonas sp. UWO 241]
MLAHAAGSRPPRGCQPVRPTTGISMRTMTLLVSSGSLPMRAPCAPHACPMRARPMPHSVVTAATSEQAEDRPGHITSHFKGVSWHKASSSWRVELWHPDTMHKEHIGSYTCEEDAARAYDCAAVKLHGPDARRNFSGEVISQPPVSLGDERREHQSSRFTGVSKVRGGWSARLWDPKTKTRKLIRGFSSEEDAARAYDCAAVKLHGLESKKLNFPCEVVSEPSATLAEERMKCKSSRFHGVSWDNSSSAWVGLLWDTETSQRQHIGCYASEEAAARAYDCAAVKLHGPEFKELNFPGEVVSKAPVPLGAERRERKTSSFIGVSWNTKSRKWVAKRGQQHLGYHASEVEAAWKHDMEALRQDPGVSDKRLNFPSQVRASPSGPPPQWLLDGEPEPQQP